MGNKSEVIRGWLIRWMYFITFGHLAAGVLLAWFSNNNIFDHYHQTILNQFGVTSLAGQSLQAWWLSLFGATLQNLAILMGVLTYLGAKHRSAVVWLWMIIGLVIWAPQDMLISLQINLWLHVWVDLIALAVLLPPLVILWCLDRKHTI